MGQKKLGRPTDNPKDTVLKIRLDKDSVHAGMRWAFPKPK